MGSRVCHTGGVKHIPASSGASLAALLLVALLAGCSSTSEPGATGAGGPGEGGAESDGGALVDVSASFDASPSEQDAEDLPDAEADAVADAAPEPVDAPTGPSDAGSAPDDLGAQEDSASLPDVDTEPDVASVADVVAPPDIGTDPPTNDSETAGPECVFGGLPACPDGMYCATGGCGLGLEGVCEDRPLACEPGGDSVCACDGNTYANACFARQAGQLAFGPGPCPSTQWNCEVDTTGWGFGTGCAVGEYCYGSCIGKGFCKEMPECGTELMDVQCACNGLDYASPCTLASAGKNLAFEGWCTEPPEPILCGGPDALECPDGLYCDLPNCDPEAYGDCVAIYVEGVSDGELCPPDSPEECGCDGVTYLNRCERVVAGVGLMHPGACGEGVCQLDGEPFQCGTLFFCEGPIGACIGDGVCTEVPETCDSDPAIPQACGCDGITYESVCHAQQVDVAIASLGPCSE